MQSANTYRLWYPSTIFSGEVILSDKGYSTEDEARKHTNKVYPDVDWIDYTKRGNFVAAKSYGDFNK